MRRSGTTMMSMVVLPAFLMFAIRPASGSVIWGNNASSGNVNLEAFDSTTGLLIPGQQFLVPNLIAQGDNGRGVAVLGNDIYYTTANSGNIYKTNALTHTDLGIVVDTGFAGIANIATDGVFLYANDYQATNGVINKYTPDGVLVGSVTLTGPDAIGASSRDGFEVQTNPNILGGATTFIANRYDGGDGPFLGSIEGAFDVYDGNGAEIISGFIRPNEVSGITIGGATGIAYDGNHYFVSDILNNRLLEFDGLGSFVRLIDLSANPPPPSGQRFLEDLSAVGNTVTNPVCGDGVVEGNEECDPPGTSCSPSGGGSAGTCTLSCTCERSFSCPPSGNATNVSFPDFSDITGLTLNGSAEPVSTSDGNVLRIVPASLNQSGSFFSTTSLRAADFSTSFEFRISSAGGISDGVDPGADGLAFVVQPVSSSIGGSGGGIGYAGISPSIAVEFDTYLNPENSDPSSNHIGIDIDGSVVSVATVDASPNFDDGNKWFVWIDYDGTLLEVRASEDGIRPANALLSYGLDIAGIINSDTAFVGFTAGTGSAYGDHDILTWTYFDHCQPDTTTTSTSTTSSTTTTQIPTTTTSSTSSTSSTTASTTTTSTTVPSTTTTIPGCAASPCGAGSQKQLICHIPPGNTSQARTLCIDPDAIAAHLHHGDRCGACAGGQSASILQAPLPDRLKTVASSQSRQPHRGKRRHSRKA